METEVPTVADVPPPPKWFLPEELAERWRVKLRRIKRLRQQGKLPAHQFSERDYRFPVDKILEMEKDGLFFQHIEPMRAEKPATPAAKPARPRRKASKKK